MAEVQGKRSKRISISLRPEVYLRIKQAADEMGLSVNAWCAYTLGSAASSHAEMRSKMSDEMVRLMAAAVAEGVASGEIDS